MAKKKTITGTVFLMKSEKSKEKCVCCNTKDGRHVFGMGVHWENHFKKYAGLEKEKADEHDLVRELINSNNLDEIEGKKVRLTIEIIE